LDPCKAKSDALLARHPELSAVRIHAEIARSPNGYTGSVITVRFCNTTDEDSDGTA
jgi:hypothetical protein